jgi:hypothetical protein
MNTPQPPNDNQPAEPTVGHAEYRKPELRRIESSGNSPAIQPDAFNALLVEKLRASLKQAEELSERRRLWMRAFIDCEARDESLCMTHGLDYAENCTPLVTKRSQGKVGSVRNG